MNILMALLHQRFPPDIRVEKEATSLAKAGHNIFLLSLKTDQQLSFENYEGFSIIRLDLFIKQRFMIRYILNNLIILHQVPKIIKRYNIETVHIHEITYALLLATIVKLLRRKIVFDVHEYYVSSAERDLKKKGILGVLFLVFMRLSERLVCRFASRIVVATWGLGDRLVGLGVPRGKIITVLNVADTDALKKAKVKPVKTGKLRDKFVVSYVGGFSAHRGLDTLIRAMPLVLKEAPNVHLLLVGDGEIKDNLTSLVEDLDITNHISFTGWVPIEKAMKYMQMSNVGVIPYQRTPQTEVALPHKLFQYMYYGKPLIVSDVKSLKKMIEKTGCGMVFKADDHKDLAIKIIELTQNPNVLRDMGKKGKNAVMKKYSWKKESKKIIQNYKSIAK